MFSTDTVARLLRMRDAMPSGAMTNEGAACPPALWSWMNNGASGKKPKRYAVEERAAAGDMGDQTAIAADSTLLVSLVVGKRPQEQTRAFVHDTKKRLRLGHLPAICTDAYAGYESAILAACGRRALVPHPSLTGRSRRPVLRLAPRIGLWAGEKQYTGRGSERVDGRVVPGQARLQHILYHLGYQGMNTSAIERHNGTSRLRNQR
jgi:hypothetical protein